MAYINETVGLRGYRIIGSFRIPGRANPGEPLEYRGKAEDLFIGYDASAGTPPGIVPNESAFIIIEQGRNGRPLGIFTAVVNSVRDYGHDANTGIVNLRFTYHRVDESEKSPTLPTIDPIIARILHYDGKDESYLGILVEGDREAATAYAKSSLGAFYHGGKFYYGHFIMHMDRKLERDPHADTVKIPTGIVRFASTKRIPNVSEIVAFADRFVYHLGYPSLTTLERETLAKYIETGDIQGGTTK